VLIRGDDTAYRRAIEHYKRTRQLVAETLAPDNDQAMFLTGGDDPWLLWLQGPSRQRRHFQPNRRCCRRLGPYDEISGRWRSV
jgi:hypothetical protein